MRQGGIEQKGRHLSIAGRSLSGFFLFEKYVKPPFVKNLLVNHDLFRFVSVRPYLYGKRYSLKTHSIEVETALHRPYLKSLAGNQCGSRDLQYYGLADLPEKNGI